MLWLARNTVSAPAQIGLLTAAYSILNRHVVDKEGMAAVQNVVGIMGRKWRLQP